LKARLRIRVDFDEGTILSPGKVRLFELVDQCGSLEQAAATLQMDLEHARHVVERLELLFGGSLIATEPGRSNTGRLGLTALGRNVVERYYAAERVCADAAERALDELVRLAPGKELLTPVPGK
jgi:molybdate transport repressor ModE-like protein